MRVERNSGAVLVETGMFAAMVAVVATVLMMVVFGKTIVGAAIIGGAVGAVVAVAMWLLMRGTLEPPRGPGNIPTPERAASSTAAPAPKPTPKPAPQAASAPAETVVADAPRDDVTDAPEDHDGANGTVSAVGTAPASLAAARDGQPDDLKQIKGVGPKLEKLLHSMGFYHFDQIAAWTDDEVAWVDENLTGFKGRVTRDAWVAQARSLTSGG